MRFFSLPDSARVCFHCGSKDGLRYRRESGAFDEYYCEDCLLIHGWNGMFVVPFWGRFVPEAFKRKS